jgi:hypothetical protein
MNDMEFTYYQKEDHECYQQELLQFLEVNEDDMFNKIDSFYQSFSFDLTPIYNLLKKDKHIQFFSSPDFLFLFLFSYDYLYLFGPLLYSIHHQLDYQPHYNKLLEKLNHI